MDYSDAISLASFVLGGVSLIAGIFLSLSIFSMGLTGGNPVFEFGFGLFVLFWVIAIGIRSYSKGKNSSPNAKNGK